MVERKRRYVEAPDLVLTQDDLRLRLQIRGVVDDVVLGQPGQDDRVQRCRQSRVGLRGRSVVAGDLRLDDRALLDGPDRLAGRTVEREDEALLRVLDHRGNLYPVHRQIHEHGRRREVVVPLVALVDLEVPPPLARLHVEREQAAAEQVVARPMACIRLDRRGVRHEVDESQLRVGGRGSPRRHVSRPHPGVVLPGLMAELPRPGDHVELPETLSRSGVKPHDVARDVLDPGLAVAGLMAHEHHDHPIHHDRRRRRGDHAELPRDSVVSVVRSFVPALPLAPAI